MPNNLDWWIKPRKINIVIDSQSWIRPWGEVLLAQFREGGDDPRLVSRHEDVSEGEVAFYLGCLNVTPSNVLSRSRRNLVVHASALPKGRGFSPLTYQIIEGKNRIPVCLLDAIEPVDSGSIVYCETIDFEGHELIDELRKKLGSMSVKLCLRFMGEPNPPEGMPQEGEPTFYRRLRPVDSVLDAHKSLAEQLNKLRTVDNERYPAYFDLNGHRYLIKIEKAPKP